MTQTTAFRLLLLISLLTHRRFYLRDYTAEFSVEDSRKSSGEESRSNSGRRGYAGYDAAWWRTCQDTEPAGRD